MTSRFHQDVAAQWGLSSRASMVTAQKPDPEGFLRFMAAIGYEADGSFFHIASNCTQYGLLPTTDLPIWGVTRLQSGDLCVSIHLQSVMMMYHGARGEDLLHRYLRRLNLYIRL